MRRTIKKMIVMIALLALMASCSTNYAARSSYVGFTNNGVKFSQQLKKTKFGDDEIFNTYDDEFIYDEDGFIVKHIQTMYFDNGKKYDEYIVEYQKIGGVYLPESISVNGAKYMEVEYEILPTEQEGRLPEYTSSPQFLEKINMFIMGSEINTWHIDIDNFEVPFSTDGKYVTTEDSFGFYKGFSKDKVLTVGYDNIVLKRFYFSRSKFDRGYYLSEENEKDELKDIEDLEDELSDNSIFEYNWEVQSGEIVQSGMTFTRNFESRDNLYFGVKREFDSSARKINEIWTVNNQGRRNKEIEDYILFEQKLSY